MSDTARDATPDGAALRTMEKGGVLPKRSLQLSAPDAARLIRDAVHAGGELWVCGSGSSMHPTVRHADLVLVAPLRRSVRRGDIVLVPLGARLMLHRVALVEDDVVVTRGDAREHNDAPIAREKIVARAIAVRQDDVVTPLGLTTRYGVAAFARYLARDVRRRARQFRVMLRRSGASRS